ncbi:MAG: hypothetical protein K0S93_79 [Nitrososphaeraceae archaeon]|jgi:hypothetical protein|nr:hypothetical protein [Nitrososphaeraceae archaeon]
MNNLREEIEEIIEDIIIDSTELGLEGKVYFTPPTKSNTEKIISLIEKEIDERIQELEQERKEIPTWDLSKEEKDIQDIISEHRIDELKYVKEMLK